jgi:hypothetical protein
MQVGELNEVAVDEAQKADSGAREHLSLLRAKRTTSDDRDASPAEARLSRLADPGEEYLT